MANNKKKSKKKLLIIGGVVVILAVLVVGNLLKSDEKTTKVTSAEVKTGDLTSMVTASGKVKAKTEIKISANVSATIVDLPIKEGDQVTAGQLLVQLDPERYQAAADQARAYLASQQAQVELSRAQMEEARLAYDRAVKLHGGKLISDETYDAVRTRYDVQKAQHNATRHTVDRARAALREAQNQLEYTTINAPIDGTITALNAENGETVVIGTMNNPGTIILTVSDLGEIEVEVEVDETDIANVELGQNVDVELDALPDTTFKGLVTEVGNSARVAGFGSNNEVTNFMVTILMTETTGAIRPGMSATCDITTAERNDVVKVPIGAVVLRDEKDILEQQKEERGETSSALATEANATEMEGEGVEDTAVVDDDDDEEQKELEGIFVIRDSKVHFVEVETGIADQQNIEIISGLTEGDEIVTGSFRILRELDHGDLVEAKKSEKDKKKK